MSTPTRIALITGASSGIGAAIADHLCAAGYGVIGTSTSDAGAERVTESLQAHHPHAWGYKLDVRDAQGIASCFDFIQEKFSTLPDTLVNNAGITRDGLMMRMGDEDWESVLATNLSAPFQLCRHAIRAMMKARFGRIINVGSIVGTTGNPGQTNYCAAKAGLVGFSKSLALEVATRGITVNVVAPGFIQTAMTDQLTEAQQTGIMTNIPMARMGDPAEIAHAVKFLASREAGYITGQTLHVNGGMAMV